MFSELLLTLVLVFYLVWRFVFSGRSNSKYLPPLHDGALPFIGHSHKLSIDTIHAWNYLKLIAKECNEKGGILRFLIGPQVYYLITDPDDCLTAANACLDKNFAYDFAKSWLGDGLITGSGEIWKRHRKIAYQAFRPNILIGFLARFNKTSRILVENLASSLHVSPVCFVKSLQHLALKNICGTQLGVELGAEETFIESYTESVEVFLNLVTERYYKIWRHNEFLYKLLGWKKIENNTIEKLNIMSNKNKILINVLLESAADNTLSEKEIREEVDTIIVAGLDTITWTLLFNLLHLGSYQEVQDKIYQEIIEVFGDTERDVERDDLAKLVYMEAAIKESMRLNPTVPLIMRYVDKDVKLKNYTLPAGSQCSLLVYGLHIHPSWGPDAETYRPERWLDPIQLPPNLNAFAPFSLGKRSCLGKTYSMISMKTTLVHLLRRYRVKADISKLVQKCDFILKPASGHGISLELRK